MDEGEVFNSNVELQRHHLGSTILVCRLDAGDFQKMLSGGRIRCSDELSALKDQM